jgi:hypothetical protein
MERGTCKLCLQVGDLQDSHFIPAAMYDYIRKPSAKNPNPVIMTPRVTATTSKQMKNHLLCAHCEDLLNNNGEMEILKWVWNGEQFPLADFLAATPPYSTSQEFLVYSGAALGLDTEKFAYFAISLLWRAAVHQWDLPFGGKTTVLDLGELQEPIRLYLLGKAAIPDDVAILLTVCIDPGSIGSFYTPSRIPNIPTRAFGLLTLGIIFTVHIGRDMEPSARWVCCVKARERPIVVRNCEDKLLVPYANLMRTSNIARSLRGR